MARRSESISAAGWRRRHRALFERGDLPRRLRHGAALSALTAAGDWEGFEHQTRWAREDRCPLAWLREIALQSYLFVGYPRAITALQILSHSATKAESVRFQVDRSPSRIWQARGRALCRTIYGKHYESLLLVMKKTHPELAEWMIREGYGKVLARPFLGPRVRELCVIALLAAQESWPQLRSHAAGALRVGAKPAEAREAVETGLRMAPEADKAKARSVLERALG